MRVWNLTLEDTAGQRIPPGLAMLASARPDSQPDQLCPVAVQADPVNPGRAALSWDNAPSFTGAYTITLYVQGYAPIEFRCDLPDPGSHETHGVPPHPGIDPSPLPKLQGGAFPFPSRADAIAIRTHFQGLWVESKAYSAQYAADYGGTGPIPYFGAALTDFAAAGDLDQICDQLLAAGDRHAMCYLRPGGPGYNEPGQPYGNDQLIPAADMWGANGELMTAVYLPIVDRVIAKGLLPIFVLWGEGQEGLQWIRDHFAFIVQTLGDRIKRGPVLVAFDGVWPAAWSVDDMQTMIPWMRSVLGPDGFLGFFFAADYLWVEDQQDYTKPWMDGLDIVFTSNGTDSATCPSLANKAGYMLPIPNFAAANCFPDQGWHFLFEDCSRGPRVWLEGEYATYQTVRDPWQTWKPFCDQARARCINLGCTAWG